jgi:FKBP-type peptidyl-prolyl cis-trans isomerase 2
MALKKKDFVEIEFTGKTKEGDVFDSNVKEVLKKTNIKGYPKPFIFCLGEGMFIRGIDEFLIGKEIGEYDVSLKPEDAFGKRNPKLIQMIQKKEFIKHNLNPIPGAVFNFDGKLAKVLTVSGGRVMIDFNNPLAGKEVDYKIKVLRKVENLNEKIEALNDFLFRKNFEFEIKDKKLIMKIPKENTKFVEMFKDKFKEILDLDLMIIPEDVPSNSEVENKTEEKEK